MSKLFDELQFYAAPNVAFYERLNPDVPRKTGIRNSMSNSTGTFHRLKLRTCNQNGDPQFSVQLYRYALLFKTENL
jgi:hypothetical protein